MITHGRTHGLPDNRMSSATNRRRKHIHVWRQHCCQQDTDMTAPRFWSFASSLTRTVSPQIHIYM